MPSKRRLDQLKSARAAAVQACKKRKSETSSVLNVHLKIKDDKLRATDSSDTEGESATWFWNESANESDSDTEEEENEDEEEEDENGEEEDNNQLDQMSSEDGFISGKDKLWFFIMESSYSSS